MKTKWVADQAVPAAATANDKVAHLLRGAWAPLDIVLIIRTPASDAIQGKDVIDAIVANTVGKVDPRNDVAGWRCYTP